MCDDELDLTNAVLFADSNRGIYIPQHFAQAVNREYVSGVTDSDYADLLEGPDNEFYWDTWDRVTNNAEIDLNGRKAFLYQDGDLWIVPAQV